MNLNSKYIQYYPFIIFFILLLVIHFILPSIEDDLIYSSFLNQNPDISSYINNYYLPHIHGWSSRYFTDLLTPIMATYTVIWNVIDSVLFTLMALLIPKLLVKNFNDFDLKNKNKFNIIAIIITVLFGISNYCALRSAGYVATTLNYTWPFIFGIINIYLVKTYIFDKERLNGIKKWICYLAIIFSLAFAVNIEICAILVFGMYLYLIYEYCYRKSQYTFLKLPKSLWLLIAMIICALLFHKFNPGNDYRYHYEIANWVGNYSEVTLINKIDLATTSLYAMMLTTVDLILLLFFGLLGIYSYKINKKKSSLIVFIPAIILILAYIKLGFDGFNALSLAQNFAPNGLISHGLDLKVILIIISYIVMILTVLYGLYIINKHGNSKIMPLLIWIIILAFVSQSVVGFAPSAQIWYFPLHKYPGRWWLLFNGMISFASAILIYEILKRK